MPRKIIKFLDTNKDIAYSYKELRNRVKTPNFTRKLSKLVQYGLISKREAIVDYPKMSTVKTGYYYIGQARKFVPEPKVLI